jgi:low temperature requirement protein LtrA
MDVDAPDALRVSTLELFFDLVFVFTITQLTTVLTAHADAGGLLRVVLMLAVIWWMYAGYAWLTNAVPPESAQRRVLLLGGMSAFLVMALAIPRAFAGTGTTFGLAYAVVVGIHLGLFTRATARSAARAILRLAPMNGTVVLLVLAGGIAGGTAQYVLWALAPVVNYVAPRLAGMRGYVVTADHFVERHGLVVLIAIGESVVAVGIGASASRHALDVGLVAVAVLGLMLSACLWWAYFDGDDERAVEALRAAPPYERAALALHAFFYAHLLILLGIVAAASTLHTAIGHAGGELSRGRALALGGGIAAFMAGDVLFRRTLRIGRGGWRALAAALALATVPIGVATTAALQLASLVAVLAACLAAEARWPALQMTRS